MSTDTSSCVVIHELFPALLDIQDTQMRVGVEHAWHDAIREGNSGRGWDIDTLRSLPFTLKAGSNGMRFLEHVNSCVRQCQAIAGVLRSTFGSRVPIDMDTLIAGALLADIGKLYEIEMHPEHGPAVSPGGSLVRHPFTGVGLCMKHHLPDAVSHIVATHSFEGDRVQRSIESIIFHHADFIDFDIALLLGGTRS
jgi:hypothetical protein